MDEQSQDQTQQPNTQTPAAKGTKVRVLVDCQHGKPNDVVTLPADEAKAAEKAGLVDTSKPAVSYAEAQARKAAGNDDQALS